MKTTIKFFFTVLTFVSVLSAHAMDEGALDRARADKSITELPDGFVKANNATAQGLADEVNQKRKEAYEDIAKKTGTDIKTVAEQAAKKIADKMSGR